MEETKSKRLSLTIAGYARLDSDDGSDNRPQTARVGDFNVVRLPAHLEPPRGSKLNKLRRKVEHLTINKKKHEDSLYEASGKILLDLNINEQPKALKNTVPLKELCRIFGHQGDEEDAIVQMYLDPESGAPDFKVKGGLTGERVETLSLVVRGLVEAGLDVGVANRLLIGAAVSNESQSSILELALHDLAVKNADVHSPGQVPRFAQASSSLKARLIEQRVRALFKCKIIENSVFRELESELSNLYLSAKENEEHDIEKLADDLHGELFAHCIGEQAQPVADLDPIDQQREICLMQMRAAQPDDRRGALDAWLAQFKGEKPSAEQVLKLAAAWGSEDLSPLIRALRGVRIKYSPKTLDRMQAAATISACTRGSLAYDDLKRLLECEAAEISKQISPSVILDALLRLEPQQLAELAPRFSEVFLIDPEKRSTSSWMVECLVAVIGGDPLECVRVLEGRVLAGTEPQPHAIKLAAKLVELMTKSSDLFVRSYVSRYVSHFVVPQKYDQPVYERISEVFEVLLTQDQDCFMQLPLTAEFEDLVRMSPADRHGACMAVAAWHVVYFESTGLSSWEARGKRHEPTLVEGYRCLTRFFMYEKRGEHDMAFRALEALRHWARLGSGRPIDKIGFKSAGQMVLADPSASDEEKKNAGLFAGDSRKRMTTKTIVDPDGVQKNEHDKVKLHIRSRLDDGAYGLDEKLTKTAMACLKVELIH